MPNFRHMLRAFVALMLASLIWSTSAHTKREQKKSPAVITRKETSSRVTALRIAHLRAKIDSLRQATWDWQDVSLAGRTRSAYHERQARGIGYLRWMNELWGQRLISARQLAQNPPHMRLWLCIQSGIRGGKWKLLVHQSGGVRVGNGEASWYDDGSPYWGGFQMGRWFHETYGGELYRRLGTANNWRPIQQIWVAERAFGQEGYSVRWLLVQWPNTAPPCVSLLG
ncbi:hypothetical protein HY379_01565 [Candidatus Saccharibacteria bacterium]|nr:hypothetical protein [Candidatus Saccharibacteria bacterium]